MLYAQRHIRQGTRVHSIVRHMHGLFQHQAGARSWRRYLSEYSHAHDANEFILAKALEQRTIAAEQAASTQFAAVQ